VRGLNRNWFAVICVGAGIVLAGVGFAAWKALGGGSSQTYSFLYASNIDQAYLVQWTGHDGTEWNTELNPANGFQLVSNSRAIKVMKQGNTVSISRPSTSRTIIGQVSGLTLTLDGVPGTLVAGSLADYRAAAAKVEARAAWIAQIATTYDTAEPANTNCGVDHECQGACVSFLSGTDVSTVTRYVSTDAGSECLDQQSPYDDLGSGGSWVSAPEGQNYPGQASVVCEYAEEIGTGTVKFITVSDAGGQFYGSDLCSALGSAGMDQVR
jgi:hypothetical protein